MPTRCPWLCEWTRHAVVSPAPAVVTCAARPLGLRQRHNVWRCVGRLRCAFLLLAGPPHNTIRSRRSKRTRTASARRECGGSTDSSAKTLRQLTTCCAANGRRQATQLRDFRCLATAGSACGSIVVATQRDEAAGRAASGCSSDAAAMRMPRRCCRQRCCSDM